MTVNKNKLIVVTGASSGIGAALVRMFLQSGHQVIGIDRDPQVEFHEANYRHCICDVRDFTKLQQIIQNIDYQHENTLINCAGIREICPISDLTIEKWEEVLSINVSSVFVTSKTFAEKIKAFPSAKGTIVNIASVSGLLGEPDRTAYVTSKHAVIGLTKQLAIEYGKYGIRVNAVAPGVIRTPLTEAYYDNPEQLRKIASGQFIDYYATPQDITPLIEFLISDNAKFITGSTLVADGGWTAGKLI